MTPAENRQSRLGTINAYLDADSLDGVLLARRAVGFDGVTCSWSTCGRRSVANL